MDKILLVICNGLSCFIICTILFQFMNERYKKSYSNRTLYIAAEIAMGITAFYINMLNFAILNLLIWFVGVGVTVYFLYYEDADRPIRRITESEVLVLCMSVCETLGVLLLHCFLQIGGILNIDVVMQYCLEVAFSKIVLIFLYYVLINRLIKRTEAACSREQYIIYGIMFFYSLVNMLVIVQNFRDGQKSYLSAVNMGCIVLADLYLLYYVKMADEKKHYENRVKALEQQAKMQYEYYLAQTEKYNQTIRILHDVDKHIRAIENLYGTEREHTAGEYAEAIRSTLAPLIPMSYTENPILNILLTDKNAVMQEKGIHSDIKIDNVEISNEGRRALREKLREVKPKVEEPIGYELTIQDTNEVEWEHYTSMREYSGLTLKDGKYNLEDVMKSMMDVYETRYNYIVKEHENGERRISYDLTGENSLTLDEDLAGLDRAYNKRLANLAGYIVCQQTNDGSKFFQTTNVKKNTAEQKEYIDTAVSMMEKAQKRFLEMREEPKYTAGIAKSVIGDIMSSDKNFMETTQRLFAKTIYHNAKKNIF